MSTPQIYIACLAAYNNGHLHGAWIEAVHGVDHIEEQVAAVLKTSPIPNAEEWAIHDYDGFEGAELGEYAGFAEVSRVADLIEQHGPIMGALISHHSGYIDEAEKAIEECYAGCYESVSDYAYEITHDTTDVPEHLSFYIDYEGMARDMEINDIYAIELSHKEVHIFHNR